MSTNATPIAPVTVLKKVLLLSFSNLGPLLTSLIAIALARKTYGAETSTAVTNSRLLAAEHSQALRVAVIGNALFVISGLIACLSMGDTAILHLAYLV